MKLTIFHGVNEEAQGAISKKEFVSKVGISLKEAKESNYFFRILNELKIGNMKLCESLQVESDEIQKILAKIIINAKKTL
jgi:four helix bundle protein